MKLLGLALVFSSAALFHISPDESLCAAWPQAPAAKCRDAIGRYFAPVIIQNTEDPRRDFITKFDFDGDGNSTNQAEHVKDSSIPLPAHVYHAVASGKRHYFVGYGLYHPVDYKAFGHENDFEGLMLVVQRKTNGDWGNLLAMETLAHDQLYQYRNDIGVKNREQDVEGNLSTKLEVDSNQKLIGVRAEVIVEAKGHGVFASGSDLDPGATWVRYWPGDSPEEPESVTDDHVRYGLIDVVSTDLWSRRLDATLYRDRFAQWTGTARQNTANMQFLGRLWGEPSASPLGARPPWAWNDSDDGSVLRGDWFIIPAFSYAHHLVIPDLDDAELTVSNYYDWNGFLEGSKGANPKFVQVRAAAGQVTGVIPRPNEQVHPLAKDIRKLVPKGNSVDAGKDVRGNWVRLKGLGPDREGGTVATLVASDLNIPLGVQNFIFIKYYNPYGVPAARLKLSWGPLAGTATESASRLVLLPSLSAGARELAPADRVDQVKTLILELPEAPKQYLRSLDIEFTNDLPEYGGERQSLLPQRVQDQRRLFLGTPVAERLIEVLSLAVITRSPGKS